jgi:hypothetical protein
VVEGNVKCRRCLKGKKGCKFSGLEEEEEEEEEVAAVPSKLPVRI